MLDEWTFCASSIRAGSIREYSTVLKREVIITPTGDWIPTDDALTYFEKEYPVWCPAEGKLVHKQHVIYETTPSARQAMARPTGGLNG